MHVRGYRGTASSLMNALAPARMLLQWACAERLCLIDEIVVLARTLVGKHDAEPLL